MISTFKNYLLKITNSSSCKELEVIQSLWSGYGKIVRYQLSGATLMTVVVKHISLGQLRAHPRGWNTNYSHNRKVKSYEVETRWYKQWSSYCDDACRIPKFLGSFSEGDDQWIVLEDLDDGFPLRKQQLTFPEVKACLKWLANFHAAFLGRHPEGLWGVGTYWHLDTRPDEFKQMENSELKDKAYLIDDLLNKCKFQTIVHGDAKLANFCFSEDGNQIAAVDFQYVGGGCGMKDVAYFLGSCLSSDECEAFEEVLLDFYFSELKKSVERFGATRLEQRAGFDFQFNFADLEAEWRGLYPVACTDFIRFLLGWMPSHGKVNRYSLRMMSTVLSDL